MGQSYPLSVISLGHKSARVETETSWSFSAGCVPTFLVVLSLLTKWVVWLVAGYCFIFFADKMPSCGLSFFFFAHSCYRGREFHLKDKKPTSPRNKNYLPSREPMGLFPNDYQKQCWKCHNPSLPCIVLSQRSACVHLFLTQTHKKHEHCFSWSTQLRFAAISLSHHEGQIVCVCGEARFIL